jgi:hypothetical protein
MTRFVFGNKKKTAFLITHTSSRGDSLWSMTGTLEEAYKFKTEDSAIAFLYRCNKDPYHESDFEHDWMQDAVLYKVETTIEEVRI